MRIVVAFSMTVCCVCYAATGAAGATTFGDDVSGDVLTNIQPETVAEALGCSDTAGLVFVGVLKSLVAVSMLTSVPINLFPVSTVILELLGEALGGQPSTRGRAFYFSTYTSLAAIYVTAVVVESAYSMVGLIGATCGIFLAFIFPGMIAMRLPLRQWDKGLSSPSLSPSLSPPECDDVEPHPPGGESLTRGQQQQHCHQISTGDAYQGLLSAPSASNTYGRSAPDGEDELEWTAERQHAGSLGMSSRAFVARTLNLGHVARNIDISRSQRTMGAGLLLVGSVLMVCGVASTVLGARGG